VTTPLWPPVSRVGPILTRLDVSHPGVGAALVIWLERCHAQLKPVCPPAYEAAVLASWCLLLADAQDDDDLAVALHSLAVAFAHAFEDEQTATVADVPDDASSLLT
jgi:hypothetical protein